MEQIISHWLGMLYSHSGFILLFFLNYCQIVMIIMVVDTIFPFLLILRFFFSNSMANILLLGGVSVR